MQYVNLNDGNKMPILGYGVYQIEDLKECQRCVEDALAVGYRLIDTAQVYFNEEAVGTAIKTALAGGVRREELFVTTKLWISDMSESGAARVFEASMKKLGLDYLDLYLLHQPFGDVYGAWRTMSRLKNEGRIRSIGVSNFYPDRLMDFCLHNEIVPAVDQVECSPLYAQFEAQNTMDELGVAMQSWAPFGEGRSGLLENEILKTIGAKHGKSVAQVILRWLVQRGVIVIPKTVSKERMEQNFSVFDFALDEADMARIARMDSKKSLFLDHRDPQTVKFLSDYHKNRS
ncbi:aldo/keto reductase [Campylobacter curvus]|uniref:aldo/keto reductase n=1 Tax=Campylobacter curvus TaxID=200 RepID=UPI001470290B|nr:aldo/keto reductase [Campylobacter curvus]